MTKWNLPHNSKYGLPYKNQSISYTILIKGKQTHIVIDTEKSFDKIHHSFMGKKHKKQPNNPPGIEGIFLNFMIEYVKIKQNSRYA